jgi:hypothetical protein
MDTVRLIDCTPSIFVVGICRVGAVPPADQAVEALLGGGSAFEQRGFFRSELVTKHFEPALLYVLAAAGSKVDERAKNLVVEVMEATWNRRAIPARLTEFWEVIQYSDYLCGARWRPASRPIGAVLPKFENRGAGRSRTSLGVGSVGLGGRVEKRSNVVSEPATEGAVGSAGVEFSKDSLAEGAECFSGR